MSTPVAYDVSMSAIAAHCRDLVARHLGVSVDDLNATGFQIMRHEDGTHTGRVMLADAPLPPAHFEPGERR